MSRILLTGASGFVGGRLLRALSADGLPVRCLMRAEGPVGLGEAVIGHLGDEAALERACADRDIVFHCAGLAHAMGEGDALQRAHLRVNFDGTVALAWAAARAGVRRFVFVSSVKARGEPGEAAADEDWPYEPDSPYGKAKWQAEQALSQIAGDAGMEWVVVRPVMVYGSGGRGNLERMAAAIRGGRFPPLPETGNRRSLLHVDDLVAALRLCAVHPAAVGRVYNVAHPVPVSGAALYRALRTALGLQPARREVPAWLLSAGARLGDWVRVAGGPALPLNSSVLSRLLGSAHHVATRIQDELGWRAAVSLEAGLAELLDPARERTSA